MFYFVYFIIMLWTMFFVNLWFFILLYFFVRWRLNKIAQEVNDIVQSKTLLKEEKKLKTLVILLFIVFFIFSNIYIFMYF